MASHEGYSTWDSDNGCISVGPVKGPPAGTTDTWYPTYIDFDGNYNGLTQEIKATLDLDNLRIDRTLITKEYLTDNSLLLEWVRTERNDRLAECDWTQIPDGPLNADDRTEWQLYRQQLRDVPADNAAIKTIDDVVWPTAPGS